MKLQTMSKQKCSLNLFILCVRVTEAYQGSRAHQVLLESDFMDQG